MTFSPVFGSIADQPGQPARFFHHMITGINTGGTAYAFHLGAIADIYPRRTDFHTLQKVDTVAQSRIFLFGKLTPWLASLMIISHDHGIPIQQHTLQPAI